MPLQFGQANSIKLYRRFGEILVITGDKDVVVDLSATGTGECPPKPITIILDFRHGERERIILRAQGFDQLEIKVFDHHRVTHRRYILDVWERGFVGIVLVEIEQHAAQISQTSRSRVRRNADIAGPCGVLE